MSYKMLQGEAFILCILGSYQNSNPNFTYWTGDTSALPNTPKDEPLKYSVSHTAVFS